MFSKQQLISVAALAVSVAAQDQIYSTATISAFLPAGITANLWEVDCPATTMEVQCSNAPLDICSAAYNLNVESINMVIKPTGYAATFATDNGEGSAQYTEGCDYLGAYPSFTAKSCSMTSSLYADGSAGITSTSSLVSTHLTQNALYIASGAQVLPSSSCTVTASSTSSSSSSSSFSSGTSKAASAAANPTATTSSSSSSKGAAAAGTAVPVVYKVLVPVGAAFAAGAAFL